MFDFNIKAKSSECLARTGVLETPHGDIQTPIFMPVGTKATVKTLTNQDLLDIDSQIILANTYHLHVRPGEELVKKMGGLHKWMNWKKPILTDSGGFQVFSLNRETNFTKGCKITNKVKIDENGVHFRSIIDGSKLYFTPEKAIEIQHDLGADIIMAFDQCSCALSEKKFFEEALRKTNNWLIRCKTHHEKLLKTQDHEQALFGIVQGGLYKDLRIKSAKFVNDLDLPGNAIGGLSVGETKEQMNDMLDCTIPHLSDQKPRYLMGVGTPEDLLNGVERGVDMFDCVHPTRIARHGAFWTKDGRKGIKNLQFKFDEKPLDENCTCKTCQHHSKSYIRHLFVEKETLGHNLLSVHNLHFLLELMRQTREHIKADTFLKFKNEFLERYFKDKV